MFDNVIKIPTTRVLLADGCGQNNSCFVVISESMIVLWVFLLVIHLSLEKKCIFNFCDNMFLCANDYRLHVEYTMQFAEHGKCELYIKYVCTTYDSNI